MFHIVTDPIDQGADVHPGAGGYVTFIGTVRNEHEGREVLRLGYEAHQGLAEAEGAKVLGEAIERFGLTDAKAVHRVGLLEIGETAVRIDVAAPHRAEAFAACEWIISEIKRRVPVWKKEHYADGDSGWIGTDPVGPARDTPVRRALLIGPWTCPEVVLDLVECGVGSLRLGRHDPDVLVRGGALDQAAAMLRKAFPGLRTETIDGPIDAMTASVAIEGCDVVVDASGDFGTSLVLQRVARKTGVPVVLGRTVAGESQTMTVSPDGPCLECLWPFQHESGSDPVGPADLENQVWSVREAVRSLAGTPLWAGSCRVVDRTTGESLTVRRRVNPRCPACGAGPEPSLTSEPSWEVDSLEAARLALGPLRLIDVREPEESPRPLSGWEHSWSFVPLSIFDPSSVEGPEPVVLVCRSGRRTGHLTDHLRAFGRTDVYSLGGGVVRYGPKDGD